MRRTKKYGTGAVVIGFALIMGSVSTVARSDSSETSHREPITKYPTTYGGSDKTPAEPNSLAPPSVTPEVRAAFLAGAGPVGGLNKKQITAALANPRKMLGIPVSVRSVYRYETAQGPAKGTRRPQSTKAESCAWISHRIYWKTAWGSTSMQVTIKKQFCWNGNIVSQVTPLSIYPWVSTAASVVGWRWGGASDLQNYWYTWNGHQYGGHYSRVTVKFKQCAANVGCLQQRTAWLSLWGHYNGSWDRNSSF